MRNHKKVKILRNKFGQVLGYAFWSMFLEYLTEADGNEIEHVEMEWDSFASELGVSATEIKEIIEYCLKVEVLFIRDGFLFSPSLDEYLAPVYEKRHKAKQESASRQRRKNGTFTTSLGVTVTETTTMQDITVTDLPQTRVKESKGDNKIQSKTIEEKQASLEKRAIEFKMTFTPYMELYPIEMIKAFYEYWIQPNKTFTKMGFELQKTWSLGQRLSTWASRNKDFNQNPLPAITDKKVRPVTAKDLGHEQ